MGNFLRNSIQRTIAILTTLVLVAGCQTQPTRTYESNKNPFELIEEKTKKPIVLSEATVLVDVRSTFDFSVTHAPGAINLSWKEFLDPRAGTAGVAAGKLKSDMRDVMRKLALLGLTPETPLVVTGDNEGIVDMGRLSWTLLYLGFRDVQIATLKSLKIRYSNITEKPRENVPVWNPTFRDEISTSIKDFVKVLKTPRDSRVHLIDVRSQEEYFSKDDKFRYQYPDVSAIHIEWKEFFAASGRPNRKMIAKLKGVTIDPKDQIYVLSQNGVRSAAVVYALLSMGYSRATNVSGGYTELFVR